MTADLWDKRFTQLWTTHIFERKLTAHAEHNASLAKLILALDADQNDMTVDYKGVDFLSRNEPGIIWLRETIDETLRRYLQACNITYPIRRDIQAWPNVNRLGDYHGPHNHGWSYLSGTYYVQLPEEEAATRPGEMHPAAITFSDPRYGAYQHSIAPDASASARQTFYPSPGTLLMWPSPLIHYVHPNHTDDIRISISFNVILEWSNDYAG
ncbi:MAG: TIGR02466 family protein [Rhodospirillaceae bacterium]|nr:TIGR02466 family protein [Rhodospirillaceae bacterium]